MIHEGMYGYKERHYDGSETIIHRCPCCNIYHPTVSTGPFTEYPLDIQERIAQRALDAIEAKYKRLVEEQR